MCVCACCTCVQMNESKEIHEVHKLLKVIPRILLFKNSVEQRIRNEFENFDFHGKN